LRSYIYLFQILWQLMCVSNGGSFMRNDEINKVQSNWQLDIIATIMPTTLFQKNIRWGSKATPNMNLWHLIPLIPWRRQHKWNLREICGVDPDIIDCNAIQRHFRSTAPSSMFLKQKARRQMSNYLNTYILNKKSKIKLTDFVNWS
jgi:hypothetical protein